MFNRLILILVVLAASVLSFAQGLSPWVQHGVALLVDDARVRPVSPVGPVAGALDVRYGQATAPVGGTWSFSSGLNLKTRHWNNVAMHREGQLTALFGHSNWNLEIDTFIGSDSSTGKGTAGVASAFRFPIAANASLITGVGIFYGQGNAPQAGLFVSGSVQF